MQVDLDYFSVKTADVETEETEIDSPVSERRAVPQIKGYKTVMIAGQQHQIAVYESLSEARNRELSLQ